MLEYSVKCAVEDCYYNIGCDCYSTEIKIDKQGKVLCYKKNKMV